MIYPTDMPRFTVADACRASGVSSITIKNWMRGPEPAILLSQYDRDAAETGSLHLLSFRRVMQIALTARLVATGIPVRRAGLMALFFTDSGSGSRRRPCALFATGVTLLVGRPGTGENLECQVIQCPDLNTPSGVLHWMGAQSATCVVVNVNAVDSEVRAALDL